MLSARLRPFIPPQRLIVSLAGLVVLVIAGSDPAAGATAGEGKCRFEAASVQAANDELIVVRRRIFDDVQLSVCRRSDGDVTDLDSPAANMWGFGAPALAAAGPLVAYAYQIGPPNNPDEQSGINRPQTKIAVFDVRRRKESIRVTRTRPDALMKVGSLVLTQNGAIAWTLCPEPERENPEGSFGPTCVRRGSLDYVYKLDAGETRPRRLAAGRRIAPSSLRLVGSQVVWTDDGRNRQARLR